MTHTPHCVIIKGYYDDCSKSRYEITYLTDDQKDLLPSIVMIVQWRELNTEQQER